MATELATAYISLVPSMKGMQGKITAELAGVGAAAGEKASGGFLSKMGGVVGGVAKVATGAAGIVGGLLAGIAAKGGIDRALNIEDAKAKLTGLGHSGESVSEIMTNATASVKGTAFGLGEAATTAAGAVAAGIEPGERLQRVLGLVADAATIAGTDMGSMGSIFNKVAASNKLQGDSIAQLQDAGVPILQMVAKEMGVTAEEAAKLASDGKVSFDTFANAMEQGLGGAALASGNTFRGALKNVYAALGRVGETVMGPFLRISTQAFGAVMPLIDSVNAALKPAMASVENWMQARAPAFFARFSERANAALQSTIQAVTAFVMAWKYNDGEVTSSGFNGVMERMGYIAHQVFDRIRELWAGLTMDLATRTEFSGQLEGFVAFGAGVRSIVDNIMAAVGQLDFSSWDAFTSSLGSAGSTIGPSLAAIGDAFRALAPAGQAFMDQLPNLTGAMPELARGAATLAGAGINALAGTLSFLARHVDTIISLMPFIVAGFVAWRVATMAYHAQATALAWTQAMMAPVLLASNLARVAAIRLEMQHAAAQGTNTAATNVGMMATIRQTAANVAYRAALVAQKVALAISTAAQWAFNAAMSANPIALIIIAITALVAGLIWFFTQTELGRGIWETVWGAIQTAAAAVADWFTSTLLPALSVVWEGIKLGLGFLFAYYKFIWDTMLAVATAVASWFTSTLLPALSVVWEGVKLGLSLLFAYYSMIWTAILTVVTAAAAWFTGTLLPTLSAVWSGISAGLSALGSFLAAVFTTIVSVAVSAWGAVTSFISNAVNNARNFVVNGFNAVLSATTSIFNSVVGFVASIPGRVIGGLAALGSLGGQALGWFGGVLNAGTSKLGELVGFVGGIPGRILSALGNLASLLYGAGRDVVNGMINGIRDMIGSLASTAADMARGAVNAAKGALGIKSPSRVFRYQVGNMLGEGFALGIEDMQGRADSAIARLTAGPAVPGFASDSQLRAYSAGVFAPAPGGAANASGDIPSLTINGDIFKATPEEIVDEINTSWRRGAVTNNLRGIAKGVNV